jgi:hypothetical protein
MKKLCDNCAYLGFTEEERWRYIKKVYHCKLHNVKVSDPTSQFCGEQNWLSIKANERLEKLKQLGI